MNKSNREAWLKDLNKEKADLEKECRQLEAAKTDLEERIAVLAEVVDHHQQQASMKREYAATHMALASEAKKELLGRKGALRDTKNHLEAKTVKLAFVGNLIWYVTSKVRERVTAE